MFRSLYQTFQIKTKLPHGIFTFAISL